jgi:hypothetical protein
MSQNNTNEKIDRFLHPEKFKYENYNLLNPDDLYYVFRKNKRYYYYKSTGENIPKSCISIETLKNIKLKENSSPLASELKSLYDLKIIELQRIEKEVEKLKIQIDSFNKENTEAANSTNKRKRDDDINNNYIEKEKQKRKKMEQMKERERRNNAQVKENLQKFWESYYDNIDDNHSEKNKKSNTYTANRDLIKEESKRLTNFLEIENITTKKQWKIWLVKNHVDKNKNGTDEKTMDMISAGKMKGWCK